MKIGIIVTSRNDIRLLNALESLHRQSLSPEDIVVADGSDEDWLSKHNLPGKCAEFGATWLHAEGASVPRARNMGLEALGKSDVIAFFDTDEYAPEHWLEKLTEPILEGRADFTGGPTRPYGRETKYTAYLGAMEERLYKRVAEDVSSLPMGNSAWRRDVFDAIGPLDESFTSAGEDYDANLRALDHGFRGVFVPEAWVYHDQSQLDTAWKILKRKYRYMVGSTMAYSKNEVLREKASYVLQRTGYLHWLELPNPFLQILAYLRARRLGGELRG